MKHLAHCTLSAALVSIAALAPCAAPARAQAPAEAGQVTRTFHLSAQMNQGEQNETITAIRNSVPPSLRVFLVPSQKLIVARGTPQDVQLVADLIPQLDHPHRQYRLTYTLTEMDGGKRVAVQRYSMVVTSGERMQMKEGSRIPVLTGSVTGSNQTEKQTTYLDVGLSFDSVVQEYGEGLQLTAKVEQSSMVPERSGIGPEDPIIRQTRVEGTSILTSGRALALGTLDILGSTRRLDVEAAVEAIH